MPNNGHRTRQVILYSVLYSLMACVALDRQHLFSTGSLFLPVH